MSKRNRRSVDAPSRIPAGEIGPGDGENPRFDRDDGSSRAGHQAHRTRALCQQVKIALQWTLSGDARDSVLQAAEVVRVEPAPDAARLRVELRASNEEPVELEELLRRVAAATPWLRQAIADSIHRRRVPELVWRVSSRAGDEP